MIARLDRVVFFIISFLFCSILFSCAKKADKDPNHVKFVWFGSEDESKCIKELVAKFEKDNPEIKVEIQMVEWGRYHEKILTMLLGGRPPDISRMSVQWCNRYLSLEALADISPDVNKSELPDFVESRLASCKSGNMLYGMPHSSIGLMMYYNIDMIEKAGIKVPESPETAWTWEEFEKNCAVLKEKTGCKYAWSTFKGWFPLMPFFYQNGGRLFSEDMTQSAFASPENIEALTWFADQHKNGMAPASSWTGGDSGVDLFARGYCPFIIIGNWQITAFANKIDKFKWGVTYLPYNKRRASNVGGENLVVFNTPKKKNAVRLLEFLCSEESIKYFSEKALFIPTRKSIFEKGFQYEKYNDIMQKFVIQSKDFEPEWAKEQSTEAFSELETDILKNVELTILGQQTPEQALKNIDETYIKNKR